MFNRSFIYKPSKTIQSSLEAEERKGSLPDSGDKPYHETIPSKVYKHVFSPLNLTDMKNARLVCKKWHQEIFSLMEEKSCFVFKGINNNSDLTKARGLADFLKVVQRDGFQWKMFRALYPNPHDAVPVPVMIMWSHLRIVAASYNELKQWTSRNHTINVSYLELQDVPMNWSKYLLIFREFENLSKLHDSSIALSSGIFEEFEKSCPYNQKLQDSEEFNLFEVEDVTYLSGALKHVIIKRARLEEVILFLKMLLVMQCKSLETLELSVEDCFGSYSISKRTSTRLSEVKMILFSHLGAVLKKNSGSLKQLKLSFWHSSISNCFDQYSKNYDDIDANLYKPDLRDFIAYIKYHRWNEYNLTSMKYLTLEFENKKIPTVEEIESFAGFVNSLGSLQTLNVSHFLLTSYNSLCLPLILKRLENFTLLPTCKCTFGISLRHDDIEWRLKQLPLNLNLFYANLSSIIVTCQSNETDFKSSPFSSDKCEMTIESFWLIDDRPIGRTTGLFSLSQLTETYPNLTSLIIKDCGHSLQCSSNDMSRWNIIDDYGMQLILKNLIKLKHIDLCGNLIYLTDSGITGMSPKACERLFSEKILNPKQIEIKGRSFSSLKFLKHCSLQYLGSKVTDISLNFGFNGLTKLKLLMLSGLIKVSDEAIGVIENKFHASSNGCKIIIQSTLV